MLWPLERKIHLNLGDSGRCNVPLQALIGLVFVGGVLVGLILAIFSFRSYFVECLKIAIDTYVKGFEENARKK